MENEKRSSRRTSTNIIAECLKNGKEHIKNNILFTKDLSLHGARVVVRGKINIGERPTLIVQLPTSAFPILAVGEIRWVNIISVLGYEVPNIEEAGIKFLKIDNMDFEKLKKYLDSIENKLVLTDS